ncbi:UPF0716 protein FxsA [Thermocatellispora tengchongensis]|uniref:UPF0716 protein FxsA n=1 Tax=Thermocatellispora tengchongensis TaxID=1073253 RepID=A0A840PSS5_9ACTN|nr:FxsA family protein [Thermocatellispora tengchongensis]MBB5138995.1 UPF0716 protein FxsA [Thermocatellispora tengchongensis]
MRLLLFLAFLVVPVLEIWLLIQVGEVIGGWSTVALLLADSLLGAWLVRREGRRAWRSLQDALASGRMPERELADAGVVLAGGMLLLTPGFLTDVLGFACVVPLTRPLVRKALSWFFARRLRRYAQAGGPLGAGGGPFLGGPFTGAPGPFAQDLFGDSSAHEPARPNGRGPVIHGQVIREEERDA